jgi:hypothetical protein
MYATLLERYNPGMNMDEEERVTLTARRVGMDLPIEYKLGDENKDKWVWDGIYLAHLNEGGLLGWCGSFGVMGSSEGSLLKLKLLQSRYHEGVKGIEVRSSIWEGIMKLQQPLYSTRRQPRSFSVLRISR